MLIIFDLDDTLIPTTSQISPFKLDQLVKKIPILSQSDQVLKLDDLKRINRAAVGSKEAIIEYLSVNGFLESEQKEILSYFSDDLSLPNSIMPLDGAHETLAQLHASHILALVTRGKKTYQQKKIDGLEQLKNLFNQVMIVEMGSKKVAYQQLQNHFQKKSDDIVVIGDRIDLDLAPAKELGFYTVQMKSSRCRDFFDRKEGIVDYQICSLMDLSAIMDEIELRNFLRKI